MKSNQLWDNLQQVFRQLLPVKKTKVWLRWQRMTIYQWLPHVSEEKIQKLHQELSRDACWGKNFIVCTICACLIATFGLISDSTAVIIGAMLVAPLMLPLRGLAFSACEGDFNLFRKAFLSIIGATILSIVLSGLVGKIASIPSVGSEILSRTQPNLIDLGIALTAGGLSGIAKVRNGISDTLAGTAIAVALMPPLCVVGLSLSASYYGLARGAFLLYLTNLLGITLACMVAFIIAGYTKANQALSWTSLLNLALIIPLGASFIRLVEHERIRMEITNKLVNETITVGQDVENIEIGVIWTQTPPLVSVQLQTDKEITPKQVRLVEQYLNRRMEQKFRLILYVVPVKRITGQDKLILKDPDLDPNQNIAPKEDLTPLLNSPVNLNQDVLPNKNVVTPSLNKPPK